MRDKEPSGYGFAVLVGVLVLAACGGDGGGPSLFPTGPSDVQDVAGLFDGDYGNDSSAYANDGACDDNRFVSTPGNDSAYFHWSSGEHNKKDATDCRSLHGSGFIRPRTIDDPDGHPRDWSITSTTPTPPVTTPPTSSGCNVELEVELDDRYGPSFEIRSDPCSENVYFTWYVLNVKLNGQWLGCYAGYVVPGQTGLVIPPSGSSSLGGGCGTGFDDTPSSYPAPLSDQDYDRLHDECIDGGVCNFDWRYAWSTCLNTGRCWPDFPSF